MWIYVYLQCVCECLYAWSNIDYCGCIVLYAFANVCVYVWEHVYVQFCVNIHVCIYVSTCVLTVLCMGACAGVYECVYMWVHMYIRFSVNAYVYNREYIWVLCVRTVFYVYLCISKCVECSPMVRETWVQSQVASYQRLLKWYLIPPCLTVSNIRYVSKVKWSNPGKGVALSPTPRCSSYWKGSLQATLDNAEKYNKYKSEKNLIPCYSQTFWLLGI